MICDKCDREVEPSDNALLYDAALAAMATDVRVDYVMPYWDRQTGKPEEAIVSERGYHPRVAIFCFEFDLFHEGEIVPGNPEQSIKNVLTSNRRGRHIQANGSCEGSPSRRSCIEKGVGGNGLTLNARLAELSKEAYRIVRALEIPVPAKH